MNPGLLDSTDVLGAPKFGAQTNETKHGKKTLWCWEHIFLGIPPGVQRWRLGKLVPMRSPCKLRCVARPSRQKVPFILWGYRPQPAGLMALQMGFPWIFVFFFHCFGVWAAEPT